MFGSNHFFRQRETSHIPAAMAQSCSGNIHGGIACADDNDLFAKLVNIGIVQIVDTLASSDYGWLKHGTYLPRPNYFAVLLWNRLMGNIVYDAKAEGHIYCHSRKDGKDGCVYLVINNSLTDDTTVNLPKEAEVYALAGKDGMRSTVMTLNGNDLVLGENDELPDLSGKAVPAGTLEIAPGSCTFIVL